MNPYQSPLELGGRPDNTQPDSTRQHDLQQKLWRNDHRCPQCGIKLWRVVEPAKCVRCGCTWKTGVDRNGAFAYVLVFLPSGLMLLIGLIVMSLKGNLPFRERGSLGIAFDGCLWLISAILLLGGFAGIAAFLDWGVRPQILSAGTTPEATEETG